MLRFLKQKLLGVRGVDLVEVFGGPQIAFGGISLVERKLALLDCFQGFTY